MMSNQDKLTEDDVVVTCTGGSLTESSIANIKKWFLDQVKAAGGDNEFRN